MTHRASRAPRSRTLLSRFSPIFGVLLTACLVAMPALSQGPAPGESDRWPDAANPDNPWDDLGRLHNEGLDYAIGARAKGNDRVGALSAAATGRILEYSKDTLHLPCQLDRFELDRIGDFLSSREARHRILKETVTREQYEFLLRIEEIAKRFGEDPSAMDDMVKLELEIDDTLPRRQADALLGTAAVARYSAEYWLEQIGLGVENPWVPEGQQIPNVPNWDYWSVDYEAFLEAYERALRQGPNPPYDYAVMWAIMISATKRWSFI